jgi:hypothetical protein
VRVVCGSTISILSLMSDLSLVSGLSNHGSEGLTVFSFLETLTLAAFITSASHPMARTQLTGTPRRRSRAC